MINVNNLLPWPVDENCPPSSTICTKFTMRTVLNFRYIFDALWYKKWPSEGTVPWYGFELAVILSYLYYKNLRNPATVSVLAGYSAATPPFSFSSTKSEIQTYFYRYVVFLKNRTKNHGIFSSGWQSTFRLPTESHREDRNRRADYYQRNCHRRRWTPPLRRTYRCSRRNLRHHCGPPRQRPVQPGSPPPLSRQNSISYTFYYQKVVPRKRSFYPPPPLCYGTPSVILIL